MFIYSVLSQNTLDRSTHTHIGTSWLKETTIKLSSVLFKIQGLTIGIWHFFESNSHSLDDNVVNRNLYIMLVCKVRKSSEMSIETRTKGLVTRGRTVMHTFKLLSK